MKKALKFSGAVAALFALVAFILLMATKGVIQDVSSNSQIIWQGTTVLFGGKQETILGDIVYHPAWTGLVGWS